MDPHALFRQECRAEVEEQGKNKTFLSKTKEWFDEANKSRYSYHFSWLGRPIIQYPQDIVAVQELVFSVQPDLIIETGIAHGGGLILYASLLELNALCGGPQNAHVLGIDIDIRAHNRAAIEAHPLFQRGRISMLQGSSIESSMVDRVHAIASGYSRVMVMLDSNHTHEHVLAELEAYARLVNVGSYCVVFDTIVEYMPKSIHSNRPWGPGNNPMTAVEHYLQSHPEFKSDTSIDDKLLITVAPKGFLKRVAP